MLQRVSVFINTIFRELQSNHSSFQHIKRLCVFVSCLFKDGISFHKYKFVQKKNTIFKRQLMNAHKRLMSCGAAVFGLKLSEYGVNKHRNALNHELIM